MEFLLRITTGCKFDVVDDHHLQIQQLPQIVNSLVTTCMCVICHSNLHVDHDINLIHIEEKLG